MNVRRVGPLLAAALCSLGPLAPAVASAHPRNGVPCDRTTIAARRMPSGPAQYQSGVLRLTNGASMRLQGSSDELNVARQINIGDPVAACYGPLRTYADAGPARSVTVLDLRTGAFYGTLIGTWKP